MTGIPQDGNLLPPTLLTARGAATHGGYYTLDELVDFDQRGLWSFAGVRFSRIGTLIATAEFVRQPRRGRTFRRGVEQPACMSAPRIPSASSSATGG